MTVFGVHASHEQVHPAALLEAALQRRTNLFSPPLCWDVDSTAVFDERVAR